MKARFLILFIVLTGMKSYSQIVNLLNKNKLDFHSEKPIKEISQSFSFETQTILTYNRNGNLISQVPYPKTVPSFSIFWEYTNNLPKSRTNSKETNFAKIVTHYSYSYDKNGYLISIKCVDSADRLINDCKIQNDSLGNPIKVETFNSNLSSIGYETAKYLYDINLVEIKVFNNSHKIVGVILNPINKQKPTISLKKYLLSNSFDYLKPVAKDWSSFTVIFNQFKYKYAKTGFWKRETHDIIRYSPSSKSKEFSSNGYITRKIIKYYDE